MKRRRKWLGNRSGVNGKETSRPSARLQCFQARVLLMRHIEKVFTFLLGVKAQTPNTKVPWAGAPLLDKQRSERGSAKLPSSSGGA